MVDQMGNLLDIWSKNEVLRTFILICLTSTISFNSSVTYILTIYAQIGKLEYRRSANTTLFYISPMPFFPIFALLTVVLQIVLACSWNKISVFSAIFQHTFPHCVGILWFACFIYSSRGFSQQDSLSSKMCGIHKAKNALVDECVTNSFSIIFLS